ncbi:hypothetical protein COOONC_22323 [Cooperia oncophora]
MPMHDLDRILGFFVSGSVVLEKSGKLSMVSTCSTSPHSTPGDPLGINFEIMNKMSASPLSSHENDNMANMLHSQSPGLELSIGEITVASAVASEKARMRQQSAMLDKVSSVVKLTARWL